MNALIIYRVDISEEANRGVSYKLQGQLYGLISNGWKVDTMYLGNGGIFVNEKMVLPVESGGVNEVLLKYRGFYNEVLNVNRNYDLLLVRFTTLTPAFTGMLKKLKQRNPDMKIVLDLPTFPYQQEWSGAKGSLLLALDRLLRKKLPGIVDYFIHYGEETEVYGIKCINSSNGILPKPYNERTKNSETFNLVAVGKWQFWHGLDRLILGLAAYKGDVTVQLDIVGDGTALHSYKVLVSENGLESNVRFHGSKTGEDLDEIFSQADLGVGTLGLHRKGVLLDSSLKHRGYCLRGLPFILGERDVDFPETCGFVKYFPGDDPVPMEEVLSFAFRREVPNIDIYRYALKNLDWKVKMKNVLKLLD